MLYWFKNSLFIEYLSHCGTLRPRRLMDLDSLSSGEYVNLYGATLYELASTYNELVQVLELKHRPRVYIEGKLPDQFGQPSGLHSYRRFRPAIYLAYIKADLFFNLVHEMFHQYQHEKYPKKFKKLSEEQREVEAQGFAVAFCEHKGRHVVANDRCIFLPKSLNHSCFSAEICNDSITITAEDGRVINMPVAVREKADEYRSSFNLD